MKIPAPPGFSEAETRASGTVVKAGKHDIREGTSLYGEALSSTGQRESLIDLQFQIWRSLSTTASPWDRLRCCVL